MADKGIYIYAVRDEDSVQGFILVASEVDIDVENSKADKVGVYHIHSVKNKPYNYTVNKKLTNVRLDEFMSVVDEDLYEFNEKNRTLVFDKKGYDNLIGQLMDDLDEENDDESSEEEEKKKKKAAPKQASARKTRSSKGSTQNKGSDSESYDAADEDDEEEKKKSRGRPKKSKPADEISEDKEENSQEEQPKPKGRRGRPSKATTESQIKKADKKNEKDEEENGEEENGHEEDENEDEEQEETKKVPGKRGRKPGKKTAEKPAKKEAPGKRGRKPAKKGSESEDNEDADDEQEAEVSKKEKGGKKKEKVEKFKKGQNNPNIPEVVKTDEVFEGDSNDINETCCSFCTNRELLRAVYTGNSNLLKKLVQSKAKVSTLFAKRGPDSDETTLEIILKNKDKKALEILINALNKKSELSLASLPECSLEEVDTGFNDRFAYGVPTRRVQMTRGGKEGNNAFVADINNFVETHSWHENERLIFSLLENETEVSLLEFLRGLKDENLGQSLIQKTYVAVRAGNRKTASYLIKQANKLGGYGFNNLHEQVLSLDDPAKLDDIKKVSVTKKSQGIYSNNGYGYGGAQGIITPIHCAAINPNPEFIKKLLDISPEFTIPDDMMRKPVHYAATCEGPGPLSYLLKQGVDAREGDKKKITPLMLACQFGRAKNVEILLDANGKSNPETRTREGYRAIHYAAHYGHLDCLKLMVEKGGVDADSPGPKRMTPLHIAASRGYFEIVEYLISKGAKVTAKDKFKRSAVIHATANGQLKILSLILKNGAPFNDPDSSGNYPVHYAAGYGFQDCLDLLKKAGANFNPQNSWNLTPLSIAMAKGHFGMVKKLLNYPECDVNCTDVKGRTIISRATEKLNLNNLEQFEFILKEKKANPNMSDLQGQAPLHYLCNLSKEAYISKRQHEENAAHVTKKYEDEYEKIVQKATQILLECGADINKLNSLEESPLIIAIQKQNLFILNILLKKGGLDFSNINQIDQNIFHILNNLFLQGPSGIEQFYTIFEEIKKDKNVNVKEFLNKVDYHGFSPLLLYVKVFSENASHYRQQRLEEISNEAYAKKGGSQAVKKPIQQKPVAYGGFGAKVAKKTASRVPFGSLQQNKLVGFSNDGSLVQLTEKEQEKIQKQADEDLLQFEQKFQKLITFLVEKGSDVNAKVDKIKKFRSNMDVEDKSDEEQQQQDDQDDEDDQGVNSNLKDEMGNPIQKKQVKYTSEYNSYGLMNIFGLALSHLSLSYLKFIHEEYPQLVSSVDYLKRNHIHKFISKNSETDVAQKVLEWLTTLKIDINQKDIIESTPLISAFAQEKYKFAKTLVNHKAQVDVKDIFGKTPLILAINSIKSNNLEFVEFLLNNGASANLTDNYGRTPLHYAINKADKGANASFDLENLLIKHKADVNAVDSLGRTPLHYCFVSLQDQQYSNLQYDPFETVSSLCNQSNIKIDQKDNFGKTPLHYGAQKNSTISVIYMIEKKANIDSEDNNGNTPLSIAFRFKRSEITTTLIQNGANTAKFITICKNLKENGEEEEEYKEPAKDVWGNPIRTARRGRNQRYNYGNRYTHQFNNYNDQGGDDSSSGKAILNKLLAEYHLEEDSYIELVKKSIAKEQFKQKGQDHLVFKEFRVRGDLPVGKHSFFKAAITFQWQGIAYLLLMKSNYNLFNALEDAIKIDLYQLSITLLNKYPEDKSITDCNSEGQTLIHILCQRPIKDANLQVKLFETLLGRGVDVKKVDKKKNISLHFAFSHTYLTPKLLELGLDCNAYNDEEQTPFALAIQQNAKSALHIYSANYKPDYTKKFRAKFEGHSDQLLFTPLLIQFANKNKDLVLLNTLLTNGSNINEADNLGRNALFYAIYHNSKKLVRFILQSKKFDIKHVDNQGKNPVHYTVNPVEFGSYENTDILELLHNAKIDFTVKDKDGNNPMFYALQQDSKRMSEALKQYNVEVPKEKKLPQRAATSIVTDASFPDEEIDYEEDSKKFSEESTFDQYKEFYEQKNAGDKVPLDRYVAGNYKKKDNYVVLDENNEPYSLLMTKVDLGGGFSKYVFYIMQVIHDKNSDVYILYTRWGQMGQGGQMQHTPFPTKDAAVKEFSKIFNQKSGNDWTNRHNFKKQDKKYQLVIFDKGDNKKSFSLKPYDFESLKCSASTLEKPIFEFVKNISNAEIFKSAYRQFALSDQYLPLTKLSKSALMEAQGILADIKEDVIEVQKLRNKLTQGNNMQLLLEREENIVRLSNRYYELVPRAASRQEPVQPLTYDHYISSEQRLVENLLDFEAAIKIIMGSYTKLQVMHPLDYCFNSLSIRMKTIQNEHPEFKMIQQYISRTNSKATQPNSNLIRNVFAVERRGEAEKIKQYSDYTKKLLWHGSGVQNLLSILNFGLRINGIHAQKSGSSLGDGIYFADLFSKASAYANNSDVGVESRFLLLCEVAVGKEQHIKTNDHYQQFVKKNYQLIKGFNSIKLVGKTCPDEKKNLILPNGTIVPIGPIIDFNQNLQQKLEIEKSTKKTTKKSAKKPAKKAAKKVPVKAAKKSVKASKYSDDDNSQDESSQNQEQSDDDEMDLEIPDEEPVYDDEEPIEEEGENEEDYDEEEEEDKDERDNNILQNNFMYDVQAQPAKTPFHQLLTQYTNSEYVVFNSAQVRIRYLVEIRD